MSSWSIRPVRPEDLPQLSPLFQLAFAHYVDHLDYRPDVLDFLDRVCWRRRPGGVVAWEGEAPVGAVLTGLRDAELRGTPLVACNLGLLAVDPRHRRQGLARALDAAAGAYAATHGADLITLMTQEIYQGHRFYDAAGYTVIERFQPLGAQIGEVAVVPGVRRVDRATFVQRRPPVEPRPDAIAEVRVPLAPDDHPAVPVSYWMGGGAGVAMVVWPAKVRVDGRFIDVAGAQVTAAWGDGHDLAATMSTALVWAKDHGADGVLAMPWVRPLPDGFTTEGGSWTLRYARPLTDRGRHALARARGYDPVDPAP